MNLFGGAKGKYAVDEDFWTQEDGIINKSTIFKNMSDDGFGCASYESCNVVVYQLVEVKQKFKNKSDNTFVENVKIFSGKILKSDL